MNTRRALSPKAAMKIKQLYAEMDQWGRHVHSQMAIAKLMGCGETTVYRVIHSSGAYMALPELVKDGEAEASLADFRERFPELSPEGGMEEQPDGTIHFEEAPGHTKLAEELQEHGKGDVMVEEMKKGPLDE